MSTDIKSLLNYYENRWEMMSTVGWKEFMEDTQNLYDSYDQLSSVTSHDDLLFKKGQLDILSWILTLKEVSEETYKQLQEAE